MPSPNKLVEWRRDPIKFIEQVLINPETGAPFVLYPAQVELLRKALTLRDGSLPYPELLYSCPKKSGKTATAAMATVYVIFVLGGPFAEGYCIANDFEQAQGRVFQAIARIVEASPLLRDSAVITQNKVTFTSTGSSITAIATDYRGAAGSNPTITVFDELWGVTSESGQRLWDELVPVPTRRISIRLTVTYAGFESESGLLERLYKRGLEGEPIAPALYAQPGLLMFWSHIPVAPWQTAEWIEQMRGQLRPNAFLRLIENRWVTAESNFVPISWWDACTDAELRPSLADMKLSVWVGLDASVSRDSTALVCCTFDPKPKKVRLVWHRIFQPSREDPLDFESTVEKTLLDLRRMFYVREVRFDPYQLQSVSQRLTQQGLPMLAFPQSVPNLTESSTNLYELIKGRNLQTYPDDEIRLAISRTAAIETTRGWRIGKEKQSHKIDVVVALSFAALGAVGGQTVQSNWTYSEVLREYEKYRRGGRGPMPNPNHLGRQQLIDAAEDAAEDAARRFRRFSLEKRWLPRDKFFRVIGW